MEEGLRITVGNDYYQQDRFSDDLQHESIDHPDDLRNHLRHNSQKSVDSRYDLILNYF